MYGSSTTHSDSRTAEIPASGIARTAWSRAHGYSKRDTYVVRSTIGLFSYSYAFCLMIILYTVNRIKVVTRILRLVSSSTV